MCYRNAILLGAYPLWRCVKIGDTPSDIAEGINAAMWTIGITATGNEIGLSRAEWEALPPDARASQQMDAARRLTEAGAQFTAASLADCTEILDDIERRLAAGRKHHFLTAGGKLYAFSFTTLVVCLCAWKNLNAQSARVSGQVLDSGESHGKIGSHCRHPAHLHNHSNAFEDRHHPATGSISRSCAKTRAMFSRILLKNIVVDATYVSGADVWQQPKMRWR